MPTKKRVRQHIMEDRSIQIVRALLPEQWVIREYKPDYGIDLVIELFEYMDDERTTASTLGETLFVQVKSAEIVDSRRIRVYDRYNVERGPLLENRTSSTEIEVARLRLETSELLTIQAMGAAIPVLLFLVELSTHRIYYVCLNDLVEKVILPQDPTYHEKRSKTIQIPLRNCIRLHDLISLRPLETYGKRAKLYAAFLKFAYQRNELEYEFAYNTEMPEADQRERARAMFDLARHFLGIVLRYDFWTRMPEWYPIASSHAELIALRGFLNEAAVEEDLARLTAYLQNDPVTRRDPGRVQSLTLTTARGEVLSHIISIWRRLENLGGIYEETGREWFLPTSLSQHLVDI
jgi:hypothetical protein